MTAFIIIVIIILLIICGLQYLSIEDYKIDLMDTERVRKRAHDNAILFGETSRRRALLLKGISEALPQGKDLRDNDFIDFYDKLWEIIQEEIGKELKMKV